MSEIIDTQAEAVEKAEIQTISIDDKKYDLASVTDLGSNIISNIQKLDSLTNDLQFKLNVNQLARAKLIDELGKEIPKFKEV